MPCRVDVAVVIGSAVPTVLRALGKRVCWVVLLDGERCGTAFVSRGEAEACRAAWLTQMDAAACYGRPRVIGRGAAVR